MKNRKIVLALSIWGLSAILTACGTSSLEENKTEQKTENNIAESAEAKEAETLEKTSQTEEQKTEPENTEEIQQESNAQPTASASKEEAEAMLKDLLQQNTSKEVLEFICDDFDLDGSFEAFALVGELDMEGLEVGEICFITQSGVQIVQEENYYWPNSAVVSDAVKAKFVNFVIYAGNGGTTISFGVKDGTAYMPSFSDKFDSFTQSEEYPEEFKAVVSAFDICDDGTGHSYKTYYYHYDGTEFREYGGIEITREQLETLEGAQDILTQLETKDASISNILYRANGIININYKGSGSNHNLTLRVKDNTVTIETFVDWGADDIENSDQEGVYLKAADESVADYPAGFLQ